MSFVQDENGFSVNIDDTRAAYRILSPNGFFGPDDHLYMEGSLVYFDSEPNEEMEALTPLAHERLVAYIEKLDTLAKEAAAKAGKAYVGRPRTLDGQLALATEVIRADMSVMGRQKQDVAIESINGSARTPEVGNSNPKAAGKRGRPSKASLAVAAA